MNLVNEILKIGKISSNKVIGMGVPLPGLIDREEQVLVLALNLGWKNVEVSKLLSNEFEFPVIIENEANVAAMGEISFSEINTDNLAYVLINEGIGCGIIIDNKIYSGSIGNAGEFGHIALRNNNKKCRCGNLGCWETVASENFIKERCNSLNKDDYNINKIYAQALKGDSKIISILKETGSNIGLGIVNIINSLSSNNIIIGGNIVKVKDYLIDEIEKSIKIILYMSL
ncbi:MAG: ROK family protein [Nanoarchaeota archaeon]